MIETLWGFILYIGFCLCTIISVYALTYVASQAWHDGRFSAERRWREK